MRVLLVSLVAATALCAAAIFVSEQVIVRRADRAIADGHPVRAMELCGKLAAERPTFVSPAALAVCRERAAYAALPRAIDGHEFARAAELAGVIQEGIDSGLEDEARALAARLFERHYQVAASLLDRAEADAAVRESAALRELYGADPQRLEQIRAFEIRSRLLFAKQRLEKGDTRGVLTALGGTDPRAPLPSRAEAERYAREALSREADFCVDRRDFAGLYRWLQEARDTVATLQHLQNEVERAYAHYSGMLFDLPASIGPMPESFETGNLSFEVAVGVSESPRRASVVIENGTGRQLIVHVRGPEDRKTVVPPGGRRTIELPPGEYVQAARVNGDAQPHIGIVKVEGGNAYVQRFVLGGGRATPVVRGGERVV